MSQRRIKYTDKLAYIVKATTPASRQIRDPFAALYTEGGAIEPPLPPEQLLLLSEENAIHAACLKAKADDAVGRGWHFESDEKDDIRRIEEKIEEITPDWTFAEMLASAAWELEALGWACWEVVRQGREIAAIYPMPAHTVRATADPARFVQIRGVSRRDFVLFGTEPGDEVSEIILFRTYSPRSPYYGLPRWISAIPAIAELTAIREFNVSWFASGGMADRIISIRAPTLAEAQKTALDIQAALREAAGRGHISLVVATSRDAALDVTFLSPEVGRREGQFLRRREDLIKEVLMAHGVPPYRIGWAELGSLGGSAAREMLRAYRIGVVEPIQTILETHLNQTLLGPRGLNFRGRWRLEDLDWEETELNIRLATDGIMHGFLTPNEARQLLGRPAADDDALDEYYLSQGLQRMARREAEVQKAVDVISEFRNALQAALQEPESPHGAGKRRKRTPEIVTGGQDEGEEEEAMEEEAEE